MNDFDLTGTSQYSQFIHTSRYARWLEKEGRRETWEETIKRYVDFFIERFPELQEEIEVLQYPIGSFDVMPSMRALMTAGPALKKSEVAGYNCCYVAVDHPRVFDEVLYILMNGTGVGFSVERQYVNKLPEVAEEFFDSDTTIVVPDSKIGWATSFRELVSLLYSGKVPNWDLSKVRPAGARLKTFGGRASGPEPLDRLFKFAVGLFKNAAGRKLNSIECHDLMCKVAEIVVVGGVRRAALISLSNVSDDRMRVAKNGQWWVDNKQRALSNNSACYTEKPELSVFLKEWNSLYESKSGERGIFSRVSARKQAEKIGRRDPDQKFGINPCCVAGDTVVLTSEGPRYISDLEGKPFKAVVNGKLYDAPKGSWKSGVGDIYVLKTKQGYEVELTPEHKILCADGNWREAQDIPLGTDIVLHNQSRESCAWGGLGTYGEGYLLGILVGDGNFMRPKKGSQGEIKTWKKDVGSDSIRKACYSFSRDMKHRSDWAGWIDLGDYYRMALTVGLPQKFGLDWKNKTVTEEIETASSDFQRAFIRGLFDSDGHVEGTAEKGWSVRLAWTNLKGLKSVQRILSSFGIKSSIYDLYPEREKLLPDSSGNLSYYKCKPCYRLSITSESIMKFDKYIGFYHDKKNELVKHILKNHCFYRTKWKTEVTDFYFVRRGEVWDAEVSDAHAFDANGLYVHNSEIILRDSQFCNLSEVVIRSHDTLANLKEKAKIAAILGTLQSTLTNFKYLRKIWKKNTEEERLLGVSLTGIMDHPVTSGLQGEETLKQWLSELKKTVIETNKEWAKKLGISQSTSTTCVKPSGTVSQLVNSSSGIHARYSRYYLRRVRIDKKDPLCQFMIDKGFPGEQDVMNDDAWVFEFPIDSPVTSVTVSDQTGLDQLKIWKIYQDYWCEHKPSCTVYYTDENFMDIGAWVWRNFDDVSGISFLPYSDHVYEQAPYESISEEKYRELKEHIPDVDWTSLRDFEKEDNTVGSQTYACSGDSCEIVDIV